jgi:hypothetical protein
MAIDSRTPRILLLGALALGLGACDVSSDTEILDAYVLSLDGVAAGLPDELDGSDWRDPIGDHGRRYLGWEFDPSAGLADEDREATDPDPRIPQVDTWVTSDGASPLGYRFDRGPGTSREIIPASGERTPDQIVVAELAGDLSRFGLTYAYVLLDDGGVIGLGCSHDGVVVQCVPAEPLESGQGYTLVIDPAGAGPLLGAPIRL